MGGKHLPTCLHCGRSFRPDVFNVHRQEFCGAAECRQARDRARRRRYYQRRVTCDAAFRESERRRCREAMRRCRSRGIRSASAPAVLLPPAPPADELLAGLVSHLADTTDPQVLRQVMNRYAERGRRLWSTSPSRGSP